MSDKHTPGPWFTDGDDTREGYSRSTISVWLRRRSPEMDHSARWREYLANERLAAAAPTMLEALIELLDDRRVAAEDKARAAIAIATKETP